MTPLSYSKMKKISCFNKRGNAFFEVLTILLIIGVLSFTYVIVQSAMNEVSDELLDDFDNATEEYKVIEDYQSDTPSLLDGIIVFVLVGLWISAILFAYFIDTHPAFFIVTLVFLIFVLILVGMFVNMFADVITNFDISVFPMTNWLMTNLLPVMMVIGFSIMIALFARARN